MDAACSESGARGSVRRTPSSNRLSTSSAAVSIPMMRKGTRIACRILLRGQWRRSVTHRHSDLCARHVCRSQRWVIERSDLRSSTPGIVSSDASGVATALPISSHASRRKREADESISGFVQLDARCCTYMSPTRCAAARARKG